MSLAEKISDFISSSKRVLVVSKKPVWSDFKVMVKITSLGIAFIALIGFVIAVIFIILRALTGKMI